MIVDDLLAFLFIEANLKQTPRRVSDHRIDVQLIDAEFSLSYRLRVDLDNMAISGSIFAKPLLASDQEYIRIYGPTSKNEFKYIWTWLIERIRKDAETVVRAERMQVYNLIDDHRPLDPIDPADD